jgi:hypothetical protein
MQEESDGLDARRERAAKNQSLFREVNERIEHLAGAASSAEFICECLQAECDEPASLTRDEYEQIRSSSNRFFVLRGHQFADIEEVVETNDSYLIVKKLGVGADVAKTLDPRTREARHVDRP